MSMSRQTLPTVMICEAIELKLLEIPENRIQYFADVWTKPLYTIANRSNNNEYVGISYLNNKWVGSLRYGKNIHQKTFKTREEAINYRKELEHKYRIDYK